MKKSSLLYAMYQAETIAKQEREGEKERARERGERVRDSVLLKRGFGVTHKFYRWLNFLELRDN
jgi:hypothetical protein